MKSPYMTNSPQANQTQENEQIKRDERDITKWLVVSSTLSIVAFGLVILAVGISFLLVYFGNAQKYEIFPIREKVCFWGLLVIPAASLIIACILAHRKSRTQICHKFLIAVMMIVITFAIIVACYYLNDSAIVFDWVCGLIFPALLVFYSLDTMRIGILVFLNKNADTIKGLTPTILSTVALLIAIIELLNK